MVGSAPSARSRHLQAVGLLAALSMFATWNIAAAQSTKAPDYAAIIAAPDRSDHPSPYVGAGAQQGEIGRGRLVPLRRRRNDRRLGRGGCRWVRYRNGCGVGARFGRGVSRRWPGRRWCGCGCG